VRKETIYIYDHIDKKELRESYLVHIPQLGITMTSIDSKLDLMVAMAMPTSKLLLGHFMSMGGKIYLIYDYHPF
jgi:hypothetical protein